MRSTLATPAAGLLAAVILGLAVASPRAEAATLHPYYLTKGQDYELVATAGLECGGGGIELINPVGVVTISLPACSDIDFGQEFRAAYTGTYQVRVTDGSDGSLPGFWLGKDCRRDAKTLCTLRSGTTQNGDFSWA